MDAMITSPDCQAADVFGQMARCDGPSADGSYSMAPETPSPGLLSFPGQTDSAPTSADIFSFRFLLFGPAAFRRRVPCRGGVRHVSTHPFQVPDPCPRSRPAQQAQGGAGPTHPQQAPRLVAREGRADDRAVLPAGLGGRGGEVLPVRPRHGRGAVGRRDDRLPGQRSERHPGWRPRHHLAPSASRSRAADHCLILVTSFTPLTRRLPGPGDAFQFWEVTSQPRKSFPSAGSHFPGQEVISQPRKSLPRPGSHFPGQEVTSQARKSLPSPGSRFPAQEVTSWRRKSLPGARSRFVSFTQTKRRNQVMQDSSYADKINKWQINVDTLEPDLAQYPGAQELHTKLKGLLGDLRTAHGTVEVQRGTLRVAVKDRKSLANQS